MGPLKKACIISVLFLSCFSTDALDITKLNLNYLYNPSQNFDCRYRVAQSGDNIIVYYSVRSDDLHSYRHYYLTQNGYESTAHDSLAAYSLDTVALTATRGIYRLTIPNPTKNLLLLSFVMSNKGVHEESSGSEFDFSVEQTFIYDVPLISPTGFPEFIPLTSERIPLLQNFVTGHEVLVSGEEDRYHVFSYLDDFGPADPAMGVVKQIAPSLEIDSSFYFKNSLTQMEDFHFYLIQSDTLADNGVTLLKCPDYFPEFKKLDELIEPLTYITTPSEYKTLSTQMTRKAFENFWLNTYGTKFRAKNAIKYFYDQVEAANRLFTDYKQGWETDRGMLYIIFGRPDVVVRSDRYEIWRYNQGIEFEFIRISTLFTPSLFSLKRSKEYEEIWYKQVGDIRKGI